MGYPFETQKPAARIGRRRLGRSIAGRDYFAGLAIGKHIRRDSTGWWIFLDRSETKQKASS
jgi:hypothetical protein